MFRVYNSIILFSFSFRFFSFLSSFSIFHLSFLFSILSFLFRFFFTIYLLFFSVFSFVFCFFLSSLSIHLFLIFFPSLFFYYFFLYHSGGEFEQICNDNYYEFPQNLPEFEKKQSEMQISNSNRIGIFSKIWNHFSIYFLVELNRKSIISKISFVSSVQKS